MTKRICNTARAAIILLIALSATLQSADAERKYAPDRKVDILHIVIDVTPDFQKETITGQTTIKFAPIATSLQELSLDAINLQVTAVTSSAEIDDYSVTDKEITITFASPIPTAKETTVKITYNAEPEQGLYFRTAAQGYEASETHLFTQGEAHTAPHWYPNYDYPNERSTSEVICRIPPDMTALSNGRLISEKIDPETNLKSVRWLQDKTHVNYLIALVAGNFKKIESEYRDIPLAFYTTPSKIHLAQNSFEGTADMMAFFEKEIGIKYPWDKYYQATVKDFVAGGMENTTLTILTDGTLFSTDSENIRSSTGLVAHELVHQWFGDYVTCKDWSHLWLNEGFATYYEKLYDKHKNGQDAFLYNLYRTASGITSRTTEQRPIVHKLYDSPDDQFDYRNYSKGGWVLHMLRSQLGEELYRRCVRTFLKRHALKSVVTEDFISVIEELSGRSWDRFFDEWVRQGRFPVLDISYSWSGKEKLAKVTIKQTQETLNNVSTYHFPATIRFVTDGKIQDRQIDIDSKSHDFYFALPDEPQIVRFDPQFTILAKINFKKPRPMLYAQLENTDDFIGRLLAIEALQDNKDKTTIAKLKHTLNNDPFHGVRTKATSALRSIGTDDAFVALTESTVQTDARVRLRVIENIGRFYRPKSMSVLIEASKNETNPVIRGTAIRGLGKFNTVETKQIIEDALAEDSFGNQIADAAVSAIRTMDDPFFIGILQKNLTQRRKTFAKGNFGGALETLAHISRNEKNKTKLRKFLTGFVNDKNRRTKAAAIGALGTLGDPKAIPVIQTFEGDNSRDRIQRAATSALRKLREQKPMVPAEINELRRIFYELKKDKEKLRTEFEDLKKRIDAKDQQNQASGDK